MKKTGIVASVLVIANLAGCGNPGGISDIEYAEYKQLGAPKLLHSCTTTSDSNAMKQLIQCISHRSDDNCSESALEKAKTQVVVGYVAGVGALTTYNKLLGDAQEKCTGKFEVLESAK